MQTAAKVGALPAGNVLAVGLDGMTADPAGHS